MANDTVPVTKQPVNKPADPPAKKVSAQEQAEIDKVNREREIMRDPHEKEEKKKAGGPNPMPMYRDKDKNAVSALRIKEVTSAPGNKTTLHFVEPGFGPVTVDAPWVTLNRPVAGGWYVVDASGRRFLNGQDFHTRYQQGAVA